MKKQFLFKVLLLLFTSNSLFSQIKFGVKGGLNLADLQIGVNIKGNQNIFTESFNQTFYVSTSPKVSFYLGGFAEMPINKKGNLFIRTELLFCRNGANLDNGKEEVKEDNVSPFTSVTFTSPGGRCTINELNLPILLKFTTNKRISFLGGCYFGKLLSATITSNDGVESDLKKDLKSFDLGINLGASYQIDKNWSIEIRHNRGLLNKTTANEKDVFFEYQASFLAVRCI